MQSREGGFFMRNQQQKSETRNQKSKMRNQKSETGNQNEKWGGETEMFATAVNGKVPLGAKMKNNPIWPTNGKGLTHGTSMLTREEEMAHLQLPGLFSCAESDPPKNMKFPGSGRATVLVFIK